MKRTRIGFSAFFVVFFFVAGLGIAQTEMGTQSLTELFRRVENTKNAAKLAEANIFAPETYEKGVETLEKAESDLAEKKSIDRIEKRLKEAEELFQQAVKTTKESKEFFNTTIEARNDALRANAPTYAPETWEKGEEKFKWGRRYFLEKDGREESRAEKAEEYYREAELAAIKKQYLQNAREALASAEEKDADRYAEATFESAEKHLEMAEDLLNRNRYDTEEAKRLADQAAYQAAHAVFLNNTIRRLKEEDADFEALLLYAEDQIERIAAATALPADFQNGIEPVVTSIVNAIGADKDAIEELKSVKTRLENRLAATKAELTETIDRLRAENTRLKNNLRAEKKATEDAKAETAALEARLQSKSDRWSAELESEKTRMKAAFDTETEAMKNKFQKQIAALKTEYEKKIEDISQAAAEQTRQVRAESKAATSDTISRIKNAHKEALSALKAKTAETLAERNREIADLQARVLELENRLAKETTEAKAMRQQLEKRRLRREKVSEISAALTDDEGRVLTDAEGNVILRLYGLSFKSGQSSIETSFYPLLSKVIDAIKRFPNSQIVVEGHTDSIGADSVNRTLSNKRAEAVRDYLLANTDISADRISAVGFGKSKPVASNDTPAGRAKNRRIDIVIGPTD